MARCPAGHESQASDYCDTCGLVIGGEAPGVAAPSAAIPAAPPVSVGAGSAPSSGGSAATGAGCPVCEAERNGRFCEECGYDFDLAEAMPEAVLTPGIAPSPGMAPSPQVAPTPQSAPAPAEPAAPAERGLDLDAELARAEAAAAEPASTSEAEPAFASSAGGTAAPAFPDTSATPGTPATFSSPDNAFDPVPESAGSAEPMPVSVLDPDRASGVDTFAALSGGARMPTAEELALVVDADQDYYAAQLERGDIIESEFPFPKYPHERRFTFVDGPVRIGRASASRGLNPEIDLTGPPLDPAVSHLHAQLLRHDEGWVVVDLGSANGTRLNEAEEPLEAETEIPVKQGDRIHLGVWTTITVL
ncbi:MAG TPA: FHA domain-containing protein [Actinospica sp.]|nr:FHA domain-containing protein [Actinospica sp.]